MVDIFQNARLKIKWANRHIDTLIRDSSPLAKDLYEITNGPGRSAVIMAQPDRFYLTFVPKEPIPEHFAAIMGDVVNNLREALDYWANAAVGRVAKGRKVHFPFAEKWEDLKTSPNYPPIEKTFPDLANFIFKEIKPCRDTNLDLWAITGLSNFNKHNDFVPTVNVVQLNNVNAHIGGTVFKNMGIGGVNAHRPHRFLESPSPIAINKNFSTSVEIRFPEGAVFENQPVIPTLLNMSKVVSQTLGALTTFMRPYL